MPFAASINFRATVGFVTDGAGQTYCLADAHPTSRGGLTFGWSGSGIAVYDGDTTPGTYAPELAGGNYANAASGVADFRLDLPAGTYSVRLALGATFDTSYANISCRILDGIGGAILATVVAGATGGGPGAYHDATGVLRATPAAWRTDNAAATVTTTGTSLVLRIAESSIGAAVHTLIAHLEVAESGDTTPPTLAGAAVPGAGTTLTATLSEAGCTPASGTGGFTLAGTHATVTSWAISGTTLTLTLARKVYVGQAVTLSYSRAATTDDVADATGNFLADVTGMAVTNNSTQRLPLLLIGVG